MPHLTRRTFAKAAVAAPLLSVLPAQTVFAQTSAAPLAAASIHSAPVGDYTITAILDGIAPLSSDLFFGPDPSVIESAKADSGIGPDMLPAPVSAFLLRSETRTILVDAGMGAIEMFGPGFGGLTPGLRAAGVAPEDVDTVILTHAHPDHLGGLLADQSAAFPTAELIVPEAEAAFWTDDAMRAQAPEEAQGLFQLAAATLGAYGDAVTQVASGAEVAPGVTLTVSPGHTPGHGILRIDGGDQQLMMIADTVHSADLQTALPDIGFGFDTNPALAAESRLRLFDELATDQILVAGSHIHFPGFGRILRSGDVYRFAPATWM